MLVSEQYQDEYCEYFQWTMLSQNLWVKFMHGLLGR